MLCNLLRTVCGFSLLRHPVVVGLILWLFAKAIPNALPAAVFFELFWLDLFFVGTYVPPFHLLSYLVFLPLAAYFDAHTPTECAALLLLCMPLALAGTKVENILRAMNSSGFHQLAASTDSGKNIQPVLTRVIKRAIVLQTFAWSITYVICLAAITLILHLWLAFAKSLPSINGASWGLLWSLAAVGGVLSLRIPFAAVCFIAFSLVFGGILLLQF